MIQSSSNEHASAREHRLQVALFVTCLADTFRPSVADASIRLLEAAGCDVAIPLQQTCCGQPGYNNGDFAGARAIAQQVIETFEPFPYIVAPSGSCAGMLRIHYPKLLDGDWQARAAALAGRVYELTSFLDEVARWAPAKAAVPGDYAYHDSCAGYRELGVDAQPRRLLKDAGLSVKDLDQREVCCGFGGTFCAKMPAISAKMADDKLASATRSGADTVIGGDLGCLLALAGRAQRNDVPLRFRHVAEVLAGDIETPAIGEGEP